MHTFEIFSYIYQRKPFLVNRVFQFLPNISPHFFRRIFYIGFYHFLKVQFLGHIFVRKLVFVFLKSSWATYLPSETVAASEPT